VLWRITIILKANKVNLFVSSFWFVFWYHSPNFLDTPRIATNGQRRTSALTTAFWQPYYQFCTTKYSAMHYKHALQSGL
jgi:hypothetical protein